MPALKMKTKSSMICSIQPTGLGVCKSSKISKTSCSQGRISQQAPSSNTCVQNEQDVSSKCELSSLKSESDEAVDHQELDHQELFDGEIICLSPGSTLAAFESSNTMEFLPPLCNSDLETIFSPIFESLEDHGEHDLCNYSVGSNGLTLGHVNTEEDCGDRIGTSCDYQTCNISDFHIADMTVNDLPFDQSTGFNDIVETNPFPDYDMMFDITERYMILPVLEESVETGNAHDDESSEVATMSSDEACLYLAIQQISSLEEEPEVHSRSFDPDEADGYDPHMYIRNLADLSEVVPSFWSMVPKETRKRKPITLVLDLDETLVHSTLDRCDDADFTFSVFFNMKEHTVYVRRRPYLQTFLERAAEIFEVMIFTASQSTYAEKLLNILDPEKKLISRRAYRESCIFSDGTYTKDLTVLGVDLAKVAIIDNSPQVFRLQVNNGIPIKSWFDDPSDRALISLLPFLETLVDADDVRPIIAKRYNNKEKSFLVPELVFANAVLFILVQIKDSVIFIQGYILQKCHHWMSPMAKAVADQSVLS